MNDKFGHSWEVLNQKKIEARIRREKEWLVRLEEEKWVEGVNVGKKFNASADRDMKLATGRNNKLQT